MNALSRRVILRQEMDTNTYKYFKTALGEAKRSATAGASFDESLRQAYKSKLEDDLKLKAISNLNTRSQMQQQNNMVDLLINMHRPK